MSQTCAIQPSRTQEWPARWLILIALCVAAAVMMILAAQRELAPLQGAADRAPFADLIIGKLLLPRATMAVLAGAAAALAGSGFQIVLRNPLAEPATLGISSGAFLATILAACFAPRLLEGRFWLTLGGGLGALALVLTIARASRFSDVSVILAGVTVNLVLSALGTVAVLLDNGTHLMALLTSGALDVEGWHDPIAVLLPCLAVGAGLCAVHRPLLLVELDDEAATALGLPAGLLRMTVLLLCVLLTAAVVSTIGIVTTVGFAAPVLARLIGARSVQARLLWGAAFGAALLWCTDAALQLFAGDEAFPESAAVMLLGTPLFIWLLLRLRDNARTPPAATTFRPVLHRAPWRRLIALALFLPLFGYVSLAFGPGLDGWRWLRWHALAGFLPWRLPRLLVAAGAGAMLGGAGMAMQRLFGNPLASPEALGVSGGAALGVVVLAMALPGFSHAAQIGAASLGAVAALAGILWLGLHGRFEPRRLLLLGVVLNSLLSGLLVLLMTVGGERFLPLLDWLNGSTYLARPVDGWAALLMAAPLLVALAFCMRWLELLPLGEATSGALGLQLSASRTVLTLIIAGLVAGATVAVGPLTFIGVAAPTLARLLGARRVRQELAGSALLGAMLFTTADWVGRVLLFPDQIPAGILAAMLGGPCLAWLMWRGRT